jgi:LPS export ABC transporter protein LptC
MQPVKYIVLCLIAGIFILSGCRNEAEIDALLKKEISLDIEKGKGIRMVYSDSAQVKLIVEAPEMIRSSEFGQQKDFFPAGIFVEFIGPDRKPFSWLEANEAVREENSGKIVAKGRVVFENNRDQKLETPELIWDEQQKKVYTDKIVRITEPSRGDTTYGFGFSANQEFTIFEIRKKVLGRRNIADIVAGID